jgi:hypothetical protein
MLMDSTCSSGCSVDRVLKVGGSSRAPAAQRMLALGQSSGDLAWVARANDSMSAQTLVIREVQGEVSRRYSKCT